MSLSATMQALLEAREATAAASASKFTWRGKSATSLCATLGANGFGFAQIRKMLNNIGLAGVADATIRTQRYLGSKGRGKIFHLTDEMGRILFEALTGEELVLEDQDESEEEESEESAE